MGMVEFLLARIAEDRARALDPRVRHWSSSRVLAECESKRQVVDRCSYPSRHQDDGTLRLLALAYADHEDYCEEWRP